MFNLLSTTLLVSANIGRGVQIQLFHSDERDKNISKKEDEKLVNMFLSKYDIKMYGVIRVYRVSIKQNQSESQ